MSYCVMDDLVTVSQVLVISNMAHSSVGFKTQLNMQFPHKRDAHGNLVQYRTE